MLAQRGAASSRMQCRFALCRLSKTAKRAYAPVRHQGEDDDCQAQRRPYTHPETQALR
jgi:hypothetical protein